MGQLPLPPTPLPNILQRLRDGRQVDRESHREKEVLKHGTLRGGSSGMRDPQSGDIAGHCHRQSHLRSLGVEYDPPTDDKLIMFQLGIASEDEILGDLTRSAPQDGGGEIILRESEIPTSWVTTNGTGVTGSPDLVFCRRLPEGTPSRYTTQEWNNPVGAGAYIRRIDTPVEPYLGLELKSVHSVWSARDILAGKPKLDNLIQSAHYMWQLGGIPYRLVYKSYSALGQGMSWAPRMAALFPAAGTPGSEYLTYNEKGIPKEVHQFEIVFQLRLDESGRVEYRKEVLPGEPEGEWEKSLVTVSDIREYYEFVSRMAETGDLGPRPLALDAQGGKLGYTPCTYCPLSSTCDKYEGSGYTKWLEEVRAQVNSRDTDKGK